MTLPAKSSTQSNGMAFEVRCRGCKQSVPETGYGWFEIGVNMWVYYCPDCRPRPGALKPTINRR